MELEGTRARGGVARRGTLRLAGGTDVGASLERTEEAWMAAYAAGDRRAFDRLFTALSPRVHAFFLRTFREPAIADDLLQTTWLKIHAGRASYRAGEPVRPWVMAIAARVGLDELRRRGRHPEDADDEAQERAGSAVEPAPLPDEAIDGARLAGRVQEALALLRESQRMVVLLHRFEGLTFAEIGRMLGITEGSARLRAFRAYEALRGMLADLARGEDAA